MRKWIPAVFIAIGLLFSLLVFSRLPATIATHWDIAGRPNGFSSRRIGAFFLPVMALVIWLIMRAVPRIDPRRANIETFLEYIDVLIVTAVGVIILLHIAVLGSALGWPISFSKVVPLLVGTLFVVLGNLLPRFRSNFFFGIRTPWTLSSEVVWAKTHRVGGYLMIIGGLLLMASAFFQAEIYFYGAMIGLAVLAVATVVYSYVAWRAETRKS